MKEYIDDEFDFGFFEEVETNETIQEKTKETLINNVFNTAIKAPERPNLNTLIEKPTKAKEPAKKATKAEIKEDMFERHTTLLAIIYHIGNGVMFQAQLIKILKVLDITLSDGSIKKAIKELKEIGFIKEQQLLRNSKIYCLYLTKYPIGKLVGKPSVEATAVRITQDKILSSLYKTEYFIANHLEYVVSLKTDNFNVFDINEILMNNYVYLLCQNHQAHTVYQSIQLNLKRDGLNYIVGDVFNTDKEVAEFDWLNKINKATKKNEQIPIPKQLILAKQLKLCQSNTIGNSVNTSVNKGRIDEGLFSIKNLISRNFSIENIQYVEDRINGVKITNGTKITLNYMDTKDNTRVQALHRGIGNMHHMFQAYFKTNHIFLEINVMAWNKQSAGRLRRESFKQNANGHRVCANEYCKAKVKPQQWKNGIVVNYKSLDLDSKYNIKSDN